MKLVHLHGLKQSVRNCPWVVEFWIGYVRAQERLGVDQEEIVGKRNELKVRSNVNDLQL